MVIEFKRATASYNPQNALQDAIEQLKNKNYGVTAFQSHELYRVAMVISTEKKIILPDFCQEIPN